MADTMTGISVYFATDGFNSLSPIGQMGLAILVLLVKASITVILLRRLRPANNYSELSARVWSWWIMAGIFLAVLMTGDRAALAFLSFLSFWALKEYLTLLKTRPADHRGLLLSFFALPVQYYWIAIGWYGMFIIFIPIYVALCLPIILLLARETKGYVASATQIQWGLMTFVFGLSHLGFLLVLPPVDGSPGNGRTMLLFLVFVVEMSDVLQYCWGKIIGRRLIMPSVSPKKTWEGLIGGMTCAVGIGILCKSLTPFSVIETAGVSLLITLAGFFGGAVMSAVKRDMGVKDFGHLIPGHGGMADRLDSLCYAAPIFFHYVRYFHY
jgi:phosphatidate cytidylyltransferase